MGVPKTLFEVARTIPQDNETGWGGDSTAVVADVTDTAEGNFFKLGSEIIPYSKFGSEDSLSAGGTLTPTKPEHQVTGSGGPVTLSASSAISDGSKDGQRLRIRGGTNSVTIQHGANTNLNGDCILEAGEFIDLEWDEGASEWKEVSRSG